MTTRGKPPRNDGRLASMAGCVAFLLMLGFVCLLMLAM